MIKREAQFQTRFGHWLKAVYLVGHAGGAYELKQCTSGSLPLSDVKEHQLAALTAVKNGKFYYKIPDDSMGAKPFDCVAMAGMDAYVVIEYKAEGFFCLIDVDIFVREKVVSTRKSLTASRAKAIAAVVVVV